MKNLKISFTMLRSLLATSIFTSCFTASATTIFIPPTTPALLKSVNVPWVATSQRDHGYISVTAEVEHINDSCVILGESGYIRKEEVQSVISVVVQGFDGTQIPREVPIATFDGRGRPGECISAVKLPINIVPLARWQASPVGDPGELRISVNTRSSSNSRSDLLGHAQVVLGLGALVATGGASATVQAAATLASSSALKDAVSTFERIASANLAASSVLKTNWEELRKMPHSYEIPIYSIKLNSGYNATDIKRTQDQGFSRNQAKLRVLLQFRYIRSIFDSAPSPPSFLPQLETALVSPELRRIIGDVDAHAPEVAQQLFEGKAVWSGCKKVISHLDAGLRLSLHDRAIATTEYVASATRNRRWYDRPAFFQDCMEGLSILRESTVVLYRIQTGGMANEIADIQMGDGTAFQKWKASISAEMSKFRLAMSSRNRYQQLLELSRDKDVARTIIETDEHIWPKSEADTSIKENQTNPLPALKEISENYFAKGGCFVWSDDSDLSENSPRGHMLFADIKNKVWVISIGFIGSTNDGYAMTSVYATPINTDWVYHFKSRRSFPENSVCRKELLPML